MKGMIPMDNICKAYVSQVKAILPVWGKKEKAFVRKLHDNLCDYCEENNVTVIDELYKSYGTPQEIVFEYISLMEPDAISKRINTAKYIKILAVSLIIIALFATSLLGVYTYAEYEFAKELENIRIESTIIEYN